MPIPVCCTPCQIYSYRYYLLPTYTFSVSHGHYITFVHVLIPRCCKYLRSPCRQMPPSTHHSLLKSSLRPPTPTPTNSLKEFNIFLDVAFPSLFNNKLQQVSNILKSWEALYKCFLSFCFTSKEQ